MNNKTKLKLSVVVSLCFAAVIASGMSSKPEMGDRQWAEIVLNQEYKLTPGYSAFLSEVINSASKQENVPVETIIAIMAVESKFDHDAHSPCHAIGLMQVRPDVWGNTNPYKIHDKYENVFAGAWVLHQYANELGSLDHAIKAYNVGITHFKAGRAKAAGNRYLIKVNIQRERMRKYSRVLDTD